MNCLVAVINDFAWFSTGMRITAFDFCAPVSMVCAIMSCWEIDIEKRLRALRAKNGPF